MTNYDAAIAIWGAIQPVLIKYLAGNIHGWLKWVIMAITSLLAGMVIIYLQGIDPNCNLMDLFWVFVKVLAASVFTWNGLWKKVFPDKDNPFTEEKEGLHTYTITLGYQGVDYDIDVVAPNRKEATQKAIEQLML